MKFSRGQFQGFPGCRSSGAHTHIHIRHSCRATCHLHGHELSENASRSRLHLVPQGHIGIGLVRLADPGSDCQRVHVELFCHQIGLNRIGALPFIGTRCNQHDAVFIDFHKRRDGGFTVSQISLERIGKRRLYSPGTKGHTPGDGRRANQECSSCEFRYFSHYAPPILPAAVRTAALMRG